LPFSNFGSAAAEPEDDEDEEDDELDEDEEDEEEAAVAASSLANSALTFAGLDFFQSCHLLYTSITALAYLNPSPVPVAKSTLFKAPSEMSSCQ